MPAAPGFNLPAYPSGTWNLWRLEEWASIVAANDPTNPNWVNALVVLEDFARAARGSLSRVVADPELRRVITADGYQFGQLRDHWMKWLVNEGVLLTATGDIMIVPFPALQATEPGKIQWRDDHNNHNHFSLCPYPRAPDGRGGCSQTFIPPLIP